MTVLSLSLEEFWVIQHLVRDTQDQGAEWDQPDMKRIHSAILSHIGKQPDATEDLEVGEGLLWQIENQVPQTLDLGRSNIGRSILLKTFKAIQELEETDDDVEPIPSAFRNAYASADSPSPDDYPREAGVAWRDLPGSAEDPA